MFRAQLSGAANLQLYLSEAILPTMSSGSSAPDMPPPGHKAHRNHIAVRPERYRTRFTKITAPKAIGWFDKVVQKFGESIPHERLDEPDVDERKGFALSIPARGFNISQMHLPYPSSMQEVALWMTALPFQTMTRAMHVAFPETRDWDVGYTGLGDADASLWSTLVWRKLPPPPDPEKPWIPTGDPLKECTVVFVVQPPWVMTPQDFKSFMRCKSLPPFNRRQPERNRPFTSAERVWAKLWDTCVRNKCHHWVISSYGGWVFGAFSEAYKTGQILDYKTHDASRPTIMECLVYHVASSMRITNIAKLPQYTETTADLREEIQIPPQSRIRDVEFPDSGSEWDGMDEEPGISAGVSISGDIMLSGWGSESGHPPSTDDDTLLQKWKRELGDEPPPYERETSPTLSDTAFSAVGIYSAALRGGGRLPRVRVTSQPGVQGRVIGSFLSTVVEQGPVDVDS